MFAPIPKFQAIINHYKDLIIAGRLQAGDTLPTVREVAVKWSVAHATATRAMRELQSEGYAYTVGKTTLVADRGQAELTLRLPIVGTRRHGLMLPADASIRGELIAAGLVVPPAYVSRVLGQEEGEEVVRREQLIKRGQRVIELSVRWYPAFLVPLIPEMLETGDSRINGWPHISLKIAELTGRTQDAGLDSIHSRTADEREAPLMRIAVGDAVLARVTTFGDREGVLEYLEAVYPQGVVISNEYLDSLASLDDDE